MTSSLIFYLKENDQSKIVSMWLKQSKKSSTHKRKFFFGQYFNYSNPEEIFIIFIERPVRKRDENFAPKQVKKPSNLTVCKKLTRSFLAIYFFIHFFLRNHRLTDLYAVKRIVVIFQTIFFHNQTTGIFNDVDMTNALDSKFKIHEFDNFCYVIFNISPLENYCKKNIFPFLLKIWRKMGLNL